MEQDFKNPAVDYFDKVKTIVSPGKTTPVANCFVSYTKQPKRYGTVFAVHGYGGSPIETPVLRVKEHALNHGFNFVAIESWAMSCSSRWPIPDSDSNLMTMDYFRKSVHAGIAAMLRDPQLRNGHRIAWAHCLAGRTIIDNYMASNRGNDIFNEFVFVAPYFLPDTKILQTKARLYKKDPSGTMWNRIAKRSYYANVTLNGKQILFPKNVRLFDGVIEHLPDIKFEKDGDGKIDLEKYVQDIFKRPDSCLANSFDTKLCTCVLAECDQVIDYASTERFYRLLPIKTKSIIKIKGADHNLNDTTKQYDAAINLILDRSCFYLDARNAILSHLTFDKTL